MEERPERPSDRRPNDEPYYIDSECPECGTELTYLHEIGDDDRRKSDELADPELIDDESSGPWYDEFICPNCLDGVHLDVPESERPDSYVGIRKGIIDVRELNVASKEDIEKAFKFDPDETIEENQDADEL